MSPIVQAKCPGCHQLLRIPADWLQQPMRCKHCGVTFRAQPKPVPAAVVPPNPLSAGAAAATGLVGASPSSTETARDESLSFANGLVIRVPAHYRQRSRRTWWLTGLVMVSVVAVV